MTSFAPLTPEEIKEDRQRRAAGEAEIARKEAALAEAEDRLAATKQAISDSEAELQALREV